MSINQKSRAEKNRLKALSLKKARLIQPKNDQARIDSLTGEEIKAGPKDPPKQIDSGAGFFIEEEEEGGDDRAKIQTIPAPFMESDKPTCLECGENFADSYLLRTFDHECCDKCRDTEKDGKHSLITKTDAKNTFLLKDFDFDRRDPPLKFILRKNPHNSRWGDMKLFLRLQVEKRALDVWETEEALEEAHDIKEDRKTKAKAKKFGKKLKALRMQMRGSLYQKKDYSAAEHVHEFDDDEEYDEENDEYSKQCKTCGHVYTYEKM